LAADLERLVDAGDHAGAAAAVAQGLSDGAFGVSNAALAVALYRIDAAALPPDDRWALYRTRLGFAAMCQRYDLAEADAEVTLKHTPNLTLSERAGLENAIAIAAQERGETETALAIWRRLARAADTLDAPVRAWTWRNLSLTLPPTSGEAARAARAVG
jgi:hypothetical protein